MRYDAQGRRVALTDSNGTDLGFIYAGDMVIADINIEGQEYNGTLRRYVPLYSCPSILMSAITLSLIHI